jgi:hypothetical protein
VATGPSREIPTVWQEVRQRRVGKVVVTYLALTFGGIEAAIFIGPMMTAPEWFWRACLGIVVLGFPVAVVLGWTYDITPKGVVRTPDDLDGGPGEPTSNVWLVLTVLGVVVGTGLHLLRG